MAGYEERVGAELGRSLQINRIAGLVRAERDYLLDAAIDAGRVQIDFRAYMGTYDSQPDTALALVGSYTSSGAFIQETIRLSTSHTNGEMRLVGARNKLPVGTRSVKVYLASQNTQGYCDAYFDRVSLVLSLV